MRIAHDQSFRVLVVIVEMRIVDEIAGQEGDVRSGWSGVAQSECLEIVVGVVDQLVESSPDDSSSPPNDHCSGYVEDASDENRQDQTKEKEEPEPPLKDLVLIIALGLHGEIFSILKVDKHGYESDEYIEDPDG